MKHNVNNTLTKINIIRMHFAGFKCFNVHMRMMQYHSRLQHAPNKTKFGIASSKSAH